MDYGNHSHGISYDSSRGGFITCDPVPCETACEPADEDYAVSAEIRRMIYEEQETAAKAKAAAMLAEFRAALGDLADGAVVTFNRVVPSRSDPAGQVTLSYALVRSAGGRWYSTGVSPKVHSTDGEFIIWLAKQRVPVTSIEILKR